MRSVDVVEIEVLEVAPASNVKPLIEPEAEGEGEAGLIREQSRS